MENVNVGSEFGNVKLYDKSMKVQNIAQLPGGTGAPYLETMRAHNGDLVAVSWKRVLPVTAPSDRLFICFNS